MPQYPGVFSAAGVAPEENQPVAFDGSTYLQTSAIPLGADKVLGGSLWFNLTDNGGSSNHILSFTLTGGAAQIDLFLTSGGSLELHARDASQTNILAMTISGVGFGDWNHLLFWVDMANSANRWAFLNNASAAPSFPTYTDAAIDFGDDVTVGADQDGTDAIQGDLASVGIFLGGTFQTDDSTTWRKFIKEDGTPESATQWPSGADIQLTGEVDNWHNNKAGNGFTLTGTLTLGTEPIEVTSDVLPDVAWWKLDDGSGTTAVDSVSSFDLTLANMDNSNWTTGQIGGALQFNDGVTNEIATVASDPGLEGFSAFSLSAWIHPTAHHTGSGGRIITKSTGSSSDDYSLMVSEVGVGETEVDFRTTTGGGTNHLEAGGELLSLNTWHHVVGTWDGSTMRLYLDGAETTGSPLATTGSLVDSNQTLGVGNHPDATSRFFEGIVDDVRIYGRALTAQEVSDVFAAGGGA